MPVKQPPAKTPALSASPAPRRDVTGARPTEVSFLRHRHPLGKGSALPALPGGFVELAERICRVRGGDARPWRAEAPRGVWGGGEGLGRGARCIWGLAQPGRVPGTQNWAHSGLILAGASAFPMLTLPLGLGGSEGQAVVVAEC